MTCVNEDDFDLVWRVFPDCNKCNPNLRVVKWNKKTTIPFIEKNNFLLDKKKSSHIQKQKTLSDYQ